MLNGKNILIVVAHSDDETFGMGAVIRRHKLKGDTIRAVSMTDGVGARGKGNFAEVKARSENALLASDILGFKWIENYDFKDNCMDNYPLLTITKAIEAVKARFKIDIVYTHSSSDLNVDHRIVSHAVLTAFRPQPRETCSEIRQFEVASSTDFGSGIINGKFNPNLFIDITDTWSSKEKALNAYSSELRGYPHSRSVEAIKHLAQHRGNIVGLPMAECFEVVRKIER